MTIRFSNDERTLLNIDSYSESGFQSCQYGIEASSLDDPWGDEGVSVNPRWRTNERQVIHEAAPWARLEKRSVTTPDGVTLDDWYFADLPSFVNVLVRTRDHRFLILEVDKYACDGLSYSLVGGYVEAGESPLEAVKRELLEETGFESSSWISLGNAVIDPNRGCGSAYFFFADEAFRSTSALAPDREQVGEIFLDQAELEMALSAGRFRAIPWAACAMQGLLWMSRQSR